MNDSATAASASELNGQTVLESARYIRIATPTDPVHRAPRQSQCRVAANWTNGISMKTGPDTRSARNARITKLETSIRCLMKVPRTRWTWAFQTKWAAAIA